ncbi:MFS general substrate transporter [Marasmius fiardii PR-910]|nr:MFS general substrate transporter [Marasmius fiardii PR-910]
MPRSPIPIREVELLPSNRPNLTRPSTPTRLAGTMADEPLHECAYSSENEDATPTRLAEVMAVGSICADVDEPLHESLQPSQHEGETIAVDEEVEPDDPEEEQRKLLPWWRKPSPLWLIILLPFTGMAMATTIAPRVEIYTTLICRERRPDIFPEAGFASMDDHSRVCFSDPVVSAAVAKLAATMTMITGVLSCLTTAWWAAFSDRHGRIRTLGLALTGVLVTDAVFILVYYYSERLPGGYWFLLVGPVCDGLLGGHITAGATKQAYFADTTTAARRSRMFSLSTGLMFMGSALGPALGGLIMRFTHNLVSVFYVAAFAHTVYACMVWFVIPESLTKRKMLLAVEKQHQRAISISSSGGLKPRLKRWFSFLSDLSVFGPSYNFDSSPSPKRNWSLTFIAISYALVVSIVGSYNNKFQYAATTFGWTSETISYWLSLIGATRAIFLAAVLPFIIKLFNDKSKTPKARPPMSEEQEPLIDSPRSSKSYVQRSSPSPPSKLQEARSSRFDLEIARVSLGLMIISYAAMSLAMSSFSFTFFAIVEALGSGYTPAIQSVALTLYGGKGEETGRFFGALSILQALSSQILGPVIFGLLYASTVATYPQMIFFASAACVILAFISLAFVRLPRVKVVRDSLGAGGC